MNVAPLPPPPPPIFAKHGSFDAFASLLDTLPPSRTPVLSKCDSFDTFCEFNSTTPALPPPGLVSSLLATAPNAVTTIAVLPASDMVVSPVVAAPNVRARKRPRHTRNTSATSVADLSFLSSSSGFADSDIEEKDSWIGFSSSSSNCRGSAVGNLEHNDFDTSLEIVVSDLNWTDLKLPPFLEASSSTDSRNSVLTAIHEYPQEADATDEEYSAEATLKRKARMVKMRARRSQRQAASVVGRFRKAKTVCAKKRKSSGCSKRQTSRSLNAQKLRGLPEVVRKVLKEDSAIARGKYKCSLCGKPKEGHVCAVGEVRSIHTQCDLSVTGFARSNPGRGF